jgi:hypothetical protein
MKKSLLFILSILSITYSSFAQNNCTAPVITEVKGGGTYCPDEEITLEVTGTLNNATTWTWYSDSCGGANIGTGTTLKVKVTKTTTYYVRGTGGCVGATATCSSVEVKRDNVGPEIISSPQDTVVSNTQGECGAKVTFTPPKGKDTCSDTVYVKLTAGLDPGSFFPVGITEVKYELSDTIGNTTIYSFKVTVEDKELPTITCANNIIVNNEPGKCGAVVTYQTPVGSDNCPGVVTTQTTGLGSGAFFPVGITKETYVVKDAAGNIDSCSFTITVKDVEAPIIKVRNKETVLWPANHKHHSVEIADYIESVSDNCGGITIQDVIIDEIGSDEPNNDKGDGNTTDDIVISGECKSAQLLAERAGNGNGRVYEVTMAVMDLHGNIGTAKFIVEVPHDMSKKKSTTKDSIIYVQNGCDLAVDSSETEPSAASATASIKENESSRVTGTVSVYPNPFNGSFSLTFTAKEDDNLKVELYNLMGMKISDLLVQTVEADKSYQWTFEKPSENLNQYILIISGSKTRQIVRLMSK